MISLDPIGVIRSPLKRRDDAPRFGSEGAPDAWLEVNPEMAAGLLGVAAGKELVLLTWLHESRRDRLQVHPRGDEQLPLTGVFLTRSPDRPNPIGLHRVTVRSVDGPRLEVGPLEALDGTPVLDIKPAIPRQPDPSSLFVGSPEVDD